MNKNKITIKEAVRFHGHLGPYLVLGVLMGSLALKELRVKKHFEIDATIRGAINKPKSCLIDGIQLSTGCTFGKGNIRKSAWDKIEVLFRNLKNNKKLKMSLKEDLIRKLDKLKGHADSEESARELYRTNPFKIFNLTTYSL